VAALRPVRTAILVNGPPGAGKTAVARPLARHLGLPLIGKDVIKERHADILGHESLDGRAQREWNSLLGAAASETMWELLGDTPDGAVLDSVWTRPVLHQVVNGLRRAHVDLALEVWCDVPESVARARCAYRHAERHPIHGELPSDVEWAARWSDAQPLQLGPTLRIDTTGHVELDEVASWVRAQVAQ
jgi:predicted kinase